MTGTPPRGRAAATREEAPTDEARRNMVSNGSGGKGSDPMAVGWIWHRWHTTTRGAEGGGSNVDTREAARAGGRLRPWWERVEWSGARLGLGWLDLIVGLGLVSFGNSSIQFLRVGN